MKIPQTNDMAEQYRLPDEQLRLSTFAERIGHLDMVLSRVLPTSEAAVEKHYQRVVGSTVANSQNMFPRKKVGYMSTAHSLADTGKVAVDINGFNQVAQLDEYAPLGTEDAVLWTDLPEDVAPPAVNPEHRAYNDPIDSLEGVDPSATEKLDTDKARQAIDEIHRNAPDVKLELPQ